MSILMAFIATLGGAIVSLSNRTVSSFRIGAATSASFTVDNSGVLKSDTYPGGVVTLDDWIAPVSAAPGAYEVRATVNSGSLTSGTTGSWLALTSDRTWSVSQNSVGTKTCVITVEIRLGTTVLATGEITLSATYDTL